MKQKSSWCFTCEFWAFAQSYTGEQGNKSFDAILDDCLWHSVKKDFISRSTLTQIWHKYVEIRPVEKLRDNTTLELVVFCDNSTIELECDCVNTKQLLRGIIKNLK